MAKHILQMDDPVLRKKAESVPLDKITTPKIQGVIGDMKEAMHSQDDAVGIAAPQIGVSLCIFLVAGDMVAGNRGRTPNERKNTQNEETEKNGNNDLVCINPEIVRSSKNNVTLEEGCLSVRWKYGHIDRADKVTLRAYDIEGKKFTRGASGLLAQIFQHEVDHLNGILFIDKAKNTWEQSPQKYMK